MANDLDRFSALADPTRRAVFERLLAGPRSVQEIADGMPVSRPAVSQHLKVLRESGLVVPEERGSRRYYRANPAGLARLHADVERFWKRALDAYERAVERRE